jgi:hypothetical protein
MAMTTTLVIADPDEVEAIGESFEPLQDWRGVALEGIDPAKIAMLHCILTGETFDEVVTQYEPIYAASAEGPWVIAVPREPIAKLPLLEEDVLEQIGDEWAATEDFERDNWPATDVQEVLAELAALASIGIAQEKAMFIRIDEYPEAP